MNVAIILNWCASNDSIKCIDSVLAYCRGIDRIIVVDNNSPSNDFEKISIWVDERQLQEVVVVLKNDVNNGYAGGNNFGIRWCRKNLNVKYYWIINNDAFVKSDAFQPMITIVEQKKKLIVGSVVLNAASGMVECYGGGILYSLLGKAKLFGKGLPIDKVQNEIETPDYIMGCSMLISNDLISEVGYMDESYFMYSEELDLQTRAKNCGYDLAVAKSSIVYHEGSKSSGRGDFYHYYRNRSAIKYNKKYFGVYHAFISCLLLSLITIFLEYKKPKNIIAGLNGAFAGLNA